MSVLCSQWATKGLKERGGRMAASLFVQPCVGISNCLREGRLPRLIVVSKTTLEVLTGVGSDNSLECFAECGVGFVAD
jgi:hypothetical protein